MGSSSSARFKFVRCYSIDPQEKESLALLVSELIPKFQETPPCPGLIL